MVVRVLIGVDAPILRTGLEHVVEGCRAVDVVGWAGDPLELVEQVGPRSPEVIVAFFDSLQAATDVARAVPELPVLAVTHVRREEDLLDALRGGVKGLLERTCTPAQVVDAVDLLHRGQLVYPPGWERAVVDRLERMQAWGSRTGEEALALTPRETEVLVLLLEGRSVKQVASRLGIALQTTKNHVHHVMVKTGTTSRVELVTWAMRQGYRPSSMTTARRAEPEGHDTNGRLGADLRRRTGSPGARQG